MHFLHAGNRLGRGQIQGTLIAKVLEMERGEKKRKKVPGEVLVHEAGLHIPCLHGEWHS